MGACVLVNSMLGNCTSHFPRWQTELESQLNTATGTSEEDTRGPLHITLQLGVVMREDHAAYCILCTVSSISTPSLLEIQFQLHLEKLTQTSKKIISSSEFNMILFVHIVMGHVFSPKVMPIKYQVTEMHRKEFDLLCHHGGIKIQFFQDLRVSHLS